MFQCETYFISIIFNNRSFLRVSGADKQFSSKKNRLRFGTLLSYAPFHFQTVSIDLERPQISFLHFKKLIFKRVSLSKELLKTFCKCDVYYVQYSIILNKPTVISVLLFWRSSTYHNYFQVPDIHQLIDSFREEFTKTTKERRTRVTQNIEKTTLLSDFASGGMRSLLFILHQCGIEVKWYRMVEK